MSPKREDNVMKRQDVMPIVDSAVGLSAREAAARLARDGFNELPTARPRNLLAIAAGVAREPMFLLLIACGAIYLLLGDRGEAAMLLGFVLVIICITFVQEHKTERALAALRDLSSPRALVFRDGEQRRIPGTRSRAGGSSRPLRRRPCGSRRRTTVGDKSRDGRIFAHG